MAHEPQHPDNPCRASLPDAERIPAKIWELLRRNEKFGRAVRKLQQLDRAAKEQGKIGQVWFAADSLVKALKSHHDFAGYALEWLVPEPWFEICHTAIEDGVDLTGKQWVPTKFVKLESGSTPDPTDTAHWRTFDAHDRFDAYGRQSLAGCVPMVRGPIITFTIPEDSRLRGSKVNGIQEWRDYHASHGPFTINDSWRDAPLGFRRIFCWLWRQRDSREKNPLTNCRTDAPEEHETNFFKGWRLFPALAKNNMSQEDAARAFMFDELAEDYRVFAVPKSIRTRMEARRLAEWLYSQLAANLPAREPDIFGSALQWDILLTVEDLMREGAPFDEALQESFEKIHLKADNWHEGQPIPNQKKGWAQRGADWQNTFRVMDAPLAGTGFIQKAFPGKPNSPSPTTSVSDS
jgi:hypothetical protein